MRKRGRLKRNTRRTAERLLDKIFSRYIRARDALRTTGSIQELECVTCNKRVQTANRYSTNAGHFLPRDHRQVRFDEHNVHGQCVACNKYGSGEQYLHARFIEAHYGKEELERIESCRGKICQLKEFQLREMVQLYRGKLKKLTNKHGNPWNTEL